MNIGMNETIGHGRLQPDQPAAPAPLEHHDHHAVGRADAQQVEQHGLERHEHRPEDQHQQDEGQREHGGDRSTGKPVVDARGRRRPGSPSAPPMCACAGLPPTHRRQHVAAQPRRPCRRSPAPAGRWWGRRSRLATPLGWSTCGGADGGDTGVSRDGCRETGRARPGRPPCRRRSRGAVGARRRNPGRPGRRRGVPSGSRGSEPSSGMPDPQGEHGRGQREQQHGDRADRVRRRGAG